MEWIDGKKYPTESRIYKARFKSGSTRNSYFTVVTQEKENRKSWGKWGSVKPGSLNYTPLNDPIEWLSN